MTVVWDVPGLGFGDLWAALQYCLRVSEREKKPAYIGAQYGDQNISDRLAEMLSLIDSGAASVVPVLDKPTCSMHLDCWSARYFPCKIRWSPPTERQIAYQFDGRSSAEEKNPPPEDISAFIDHVRVAGYTSAAVGLPLSVEACARCMSVSRAFVGVCSGMAILAHSVGVPCYVLQYKLDVRWWHGQNPITVCAGVNDFLERFPWA